MRLRNKYFPYPVICEEGDSYIDSSFITDVEQVIDGYNIKLILSAQLNNRELEELLSQKIVSIAHHIECSQTCFRKVILTNEEKDDYILRDGQVNGEVEVCSFLVANQDIMKYSNELFSSDYKGFKFDIEKGCIMAIGNQINLRIDKIRDDLANTASIFSIIPVIDPLATDIEVDITNRNNKISILIPEKTFALYNHMSGFMDMQPVMHSMFIVPALMHAFSELKESRDQLYIYEDLRWFRSLKKTCGKMGIVLDSEGLTSIDPFIVAQKLLDSPIVKAIDYLGAGGEIDED